VPALAFIDQPLPDDQLAIILIGQKHQGPSRYIVVEKRSFTDEVLDRAMDVVLQWQLAHPSDESATVVTVYKDGRYDGRSDENQSSGKLDFRRFGSKRETRSHELLTKADAAAPVNLPKFGKVRLVPLS
jgi:hypothetical protein